RRGGRRLRACENARVLRERRRQRLERRVTLTGAGLGRAARRQQVQERAPLGARGGFEREGVFVEVVEQADRQREDLLDRLAVALLHEVGRHELRPPVLEQREGLSRVRA